MRPLRVIPCACCQRPKLRETDPEKHPGHYSQVTADGWCLCVEDFSGKTLEVGPGLVTATELLRQYTEAVLALNRGNKSKAARMLGVDRRTIYRWLDTTKEICE